MCRRIAYLVLSMGVLAQPLSAQTRTESGVTITGGTDTAGHEYRWTVANKAASPIIYLEFPQYHGDLCLPPEGWTSELSPAACVCRAPSAIEGIAPGRSLDVRVRVGPLGAQRGQGGVIVRFADGTEKKVGGVDLPVPESTGDQFVPLIGLGIVMLVVILAQRRGRRRKDAAADTSGAPTE